MIRPAPSEPRYRDAANLTIEAANGVSYRYRRYGDPDGATPALLMLQHFRGNLDNWDPNLVDALAAQREVILFDNVGVGGTSGTTPSSVDQMAIDAMAFVDALELADAYDVLGFSLGGYVAQQLALIRPHDVRRLVLAGTGPRGGDDMQGFTAPVHDVATHDHPGAEHLVYLFFEDSTTSRTAGHAFVRRIVERDVERDEPTTHQTRDAQLDALTAWGIPEPSRL